MESYFANASKSANIGIKIAERSMPLPPASFQRFLRSKKLTKKIPGIVLADHGKQFNNKWVYVILFVKRLIIIIIIIINLFIFGILK